MVFLLVKGLENCKWLKPKWSNNQSEHPVFYLLPVKSQNIFTHSHSRLAFSLLNNVNNVTCLSQSDLLVYLPVIFHLSLTEVFV